MVLLEISKILKKMCSFESKNRRAAALRLFSVLAPISLSMRGLAGSYPEK